MSYDPNTFFLEGTLCTAQHGPAAIYIALLDEGENQLINSYIVPRGPVIDWKTQSTGLTSFTDILPYDPLPTEKVIESIREFITPESTLVGHRVDQVIEALGLQQGKDYAESVDISCWFALKVTSTLIQQFSLCHIVKCISGEDIYDIDSDERDPMVDAHWVRTIYLTYKGYPYDLPLLCQIRQHLYAELPKEKRDIDPIQTVSVSCIPHDWTIKEVKKALPKKVVHLIERIEDIQFDPKTKFGTSIVVFKNADDVSELTLRLHSNPEEWIWTVKLEGQAYTHKANGITINEMEPLEHKMYVHSIPESWNELDVRSKLVPQELYPNLKEVRRMQFRDSKDGTRKLGRTHIVFTDSWCVNSMMQYLQGTYYEWSWKANTSTGKVTWKHGEDGTLVEPAVCITWEDLMNQGQL